MLLSKKDSIGYGSLILIGIFSGVIFLYHTMILSQSYSLSEGESVIEQTGEGSGMIYPEDLEEVSTILESDGLPEPKEFSKPQEIYYTSYKVSEGDTIGEIALTFGLTQDTILSFNEIKNSRLLQIGQYLKIPNQDGLLYTVKKGDTISSMANSYKVDSQAIRTVNNIHDDTITPGEKLFIPGARLSSVELCEINGDLFQWPVRGYITSPYGYRINPFTGTRQFHSGIDIGAPQGTPVRAAMAGRVTDTGYDVNSGNYVVISHYSGYKTFYGHLDIIRVQLGVYVKTGDRIGDVGSTGLSTGSHLHFTVFKNSVTTNPRPLLAR